MSTPAERPVLHLQEIMCELSRRTPLFILPSCPGSFRQPENRIDQEQATKKRALLASRSIHPPWSTFTELNVSVPEAVRLASEREDLLGRLDRVSDKDCSTFRELTWEPKGMRSLEPPNFLARLMCLISCLYQLDSLGNAGEGEDLQH